MRPGVAAAKPPVEARADSRAQLVEIEVRDVAPSDQRTSLHARVRAEAADRGEADSVPAGMAVKPEAADSPRVVAASREAAARRPGEADNLEAVVAEVVAETTSDVEAANRNASLNESEANRRWKERLH